MLLLKLGQHAGKTVGILTDSIGDRDRLAIRQSINTLAGLSLERRVAWLRSFCPAAYRTGYREIHNNNLHIIHTYPLSRI